MRIVHGRNLAHVPGQEIEVVGIRAGRLYDRMVALMDQNDVPVLHRNGHVEIGVPGVDALNGKTIFGQETIIIGFFVIGRIVPGVVAMGRET